MQPSKDLKEFIGSLNANKVEYMVVGAHALAWHGYSRFTADVDFLVRPSSSNAEKVIAALKQFGFGSLQISPDELSNPNVILQLGVQPNRIDIITSIAGVDFETAWASRVQGFIGDLQVAFLGREALLRNKESTGRPKDMGDAAELRKRTPRG